MSLELCGQRRGGLPCHDTDRKAISSSARACSGSPSEVASGHSRPPPRRPRRRSASPGWGPTAPPAARDANRRRSAMRWRGGRRHAQIPAGYTYLGQFIDHDLTFDKTTSCSARTSRRPSCCRGARRASTWTRCTAPGRTTPVGEVLRGRRPPPEDGHDRRETGLAARTATTCRARGHRRARSARRSSPTRATTRTSWSRRRTSR